MEAIKAIVLGIVQGLTEFLPVSSSGHLELAEYFLNMENLAQDDVTQTVILHFATALSTVLVFRKDIAQLFKDLFSKSDDSARKFALYILVTMIPAGIVGVFFDTQLDALFDKKIWLVGLMLFVTGGMLLLADRDWNNVEDIDLKKSIGMGLAQMCALLPGVSRSGATISAGLLMGMDRTKAARFSFLMVLPLIFGKIAMDLLGGEISVASMNQNLILAFLAAFVVGVLACRLMIRWVENSKLKYFAFYCFIVGTGSLLWYFLK